MNSPIAPPPPTAYLPSMSYGPQRYLSDPARGSNGLWRTLGGFVAIALTPLILGALLLAPLYAALPVSARDYSTPLGTTLALASFGLYILAVAIILPLLHKRGLFSLFGDRDRFVADFRRTALAALAVLAAIAFLVPGGGDTGPIEPNLAFSTWLGFLPFALGAIFLQVSAEELVFRGYLQSQLAAKLSDPRLWLGIPALLFGLLHAGNSESLSGALTYIAITFAMGLALGDLTARTGSLGPAIALHLVNNTIGILFVGMEGLLDGLALFVTPTEGAIEPPLWPSLLTVLNLWLAARVALRV
ncbi:lysostaphin resistance A-like protein [Aestuariibius sp. 2305UL40-4]|uniref:CPBP family intramembrane glutamic endopeptidase n=1 Tax=Aestuariibius violaceus TaxID=3234132 RepID=UPI003481C83E